ANATQTCEWHEQLIWVCLLLNFGKSKRNELKLMNMSEFTKLCNAQQDILRPRHLPIWTTRKRS
ncbi:hypothetical protein M5D96_012820, partial [Drosophila gunungcola]